MLADREEGFGASRATDQDTTMCCESCIYLVPILSCLCFKLLKLSPILWCHAGVLKCCSQCSEPGRTFCSFHPHQCVITPKVLFHPNPSGAAAPTSFLTDWDSVKRQTWCDLLQPCLPLPICGKVMLTYVLKELSDLGGERSGLNAVTLASSDSFVGSNKIVAGKGIARERMLGIWQPEAPFLLDRLLLHFSTH